MKHFYSFFLALLFSVPLITQAQVSDGSIKVIVTDKFSKESIPYANIVVKQKGAYVTGKATDFDGLAVLTGLEPGSYDVEVTYVGYTPAGTKGVIVTSNNSTVLRIELTEGLVTDVVEIIEYEKDIISDTYGGSNKRTSEEISKAPTRSLNQIVGLSGGVQTTDGGTPSVKGSRTSANITYIDGMPVRGSSGVPVSSYEEIQIYTSGVPAEFGDATGGVINITSKGPSAKSFNRIEYITSQFLDGYGYNTLEVFSSGPILKDSVKGVQIAKMGYMLSGQASFAKDGDPSPIGIWKVKDDVLADIESNPVTLSPLGSGFVSRSEFLTKEDLVKVKVKPNTDQITLNLNAKIDWKLNKNVNLTVGGRANYFAGNDYLYNYSLLNYDNNSEFKNNTYAGYVRLRQRFDSDSTSKVQNAYYLIQFDYTSYTNVRQDPTHEDNLFRYGSIGKFDSYKQDYAWTSQQLYSGTDSATSIFALYQAETPFDTSIRFTPGQYNEIGANYTQRVFDFNDGDVSSLSLIPQSGGLLNGSSPSLIYSLWNDVGTPYPSYAKQTEDQVSLNFTLGGSVKNHNIKVGFRYEQRTLRYYGISATNIWNTMRQSVNRQIKFKSSNVDSAIFVFTDGDYRGYEVYKAQGAFLDTVKFDRVLTDNQTSFDKNFREYLMSIGAKDIYGNPIDEYTFLNTDGYDPEVFKLDWFSADDLLQNGTASYYGYDYLGNKLKGKPTLNDYLNNPEERKIAPYQPIYMAGYIQDEVTYKDLNLRLGVRVDRFDANQWVLDDEYSLYPIKTVSEVKNLTSDNVDLSVVPETIGDEFKVYVDDPYNPTKVVGYRDGSDWYTADGSKTTNPAVIAAESNTGIIAPYTNFTSKEEQSNEGLTENSFKDYVPQLNIMPRVAVSFPISDEAMFFANYDVLTQRPTSSNIATIDAYYYLPARSTNTIGNPNLLPERTISYEVGFQQKIASNMAIKINAYYKELRDMIQVVPRRYAYPVDYITFGNVDFGTVKGFIFNYQLFPGGRNKNVTIDANYTLQFANATGSGTSTQQALIQAGQPNLRTLQPTNNDSRHNIVMSFDYRYGSGADYNGPVLGKNGKARRIFENAGANLILSTTSGSPYSGQKNVTQSVATGVAQRATIDGTINGNRYPWRFNVDLRIDKTWGLSFGDQKDANGTVTQKGKQANLQVYLWVRNLFDTRNIVGLYRFTGLPDDDGWLSSAEGVQTIESVTFQQAYVDLYSVKVNNPSNYTLPRLIRVGAVISF